MDNKNKTIILNFKDNIHLKLSVLISISDLFSCTYADRLNNDTINTLGTFINKELIEVNNLIEDISNIL